MNESRQIRALFDAFLARFFENEISESTRDMRASFSRIIGMLAAPGLLLPMSRIWDWTFWASQGPEVLRRLSIPDKTFYLSISMGAMMLLAAVVWQALLVDRRDAIVLGSFPVRPRTIVAGKLAALFAYLGIIAGGMQLLASVLYGTMLGGDLIGTLRAVPAHFIASSLACMFACLAVAAFQAVTLALGGPRLFARLTAPAQLLLATSGLALILMGPMFGAGAMGVLRGVPAAGWAAWAPPVWFIGVYETILSGAAPVMKTMAARALLMLASVIVILVAAYPLAYRRIASAAMQGSPLGSRRSIAGAMLSSIVRRLPVAFDVRGTVHFILLTTGRVSRNKLIVASALGAGAAIALPFLARWAAASGVAAVPGRSHIAVPFLFLMTGLAGLRMAYNVPSEPGAAWIFSTAVRPARIGVNAARIAAFMIAGAVALIAVPVYAWFWSIPIALSMALTLLAFASLISEMGLRTIEFVPFTRTYSPERGNLQARWPLFLMMGIFFLQFLPWAVRELLWLENYWLAPLALAVGAAGLRYAHPPEPPPLIDADFENKPLALRLY